MTVKRYRKTATITAEQFDGTEEMVERYHLLHEYVDDGLMASRWCWIKTLEGDVQIREGDWIATGINGEHWPIANDIFQKTYVEVKEDEA